MTGDRLPEAIESNTICHDQMRQEDEELLAILTAKSLTVLFQPIIDLTAEEIAGYELFIRGPVDSPLHLPDRLFAVAYRSRLGEQLETLCREMAIQAAAAHAVKGNLWINIDVCSHVIQHWPRFTPDPDRCILECRLDLFKQGLPIDTGRLASVSMPAGGLQPAYMKVSRLLVHNVNASQDQTALIAAMAAYAHARGAKVIAEGLETEAELTALVKLGLDYAQGYLFAKPAPAPEPLSAAVRGLLRSSKQILRSWPRLPEAPLSLSIGKILEYCPTLDPQALVKEAELIIAAEKAEGIVIVSDARPVGLLMKNKLYFQLGTRYGVSLYHSRCVELIMDKNPLIVDAGLPLDVVSHLSMSRSSDNKYDFIIVTRYDRYAGVVSITHLLNHMTNLQVHCARNANPLTGLPGNILIEHRLKSLLESREAFAVLYVDLDNFKAFNDKYGFEHGDNALLLTADILKTCTGQVCRTDSFIGHIGGDDFVVIVPPDEIDALCTAIIRRFDTEIVQLYDPADREKGAIIVKNRRGRPEKIPIMTISIGAVHTLCRRFSNYLEFSGLAAVLKRQAKEREGSAYVIDQGRQELS